MSYSTSYKNKIASLGILLVLSLVCQLVLPPVGGQSLSTNRADSKAQTQDSQLVGSDLGFETEPNGTIATADVLVPAEGKITGNIAPAADVDYFAFSANAGDKIYAGVITSASVTSSTANSVLEIRDAADASLETDLDDGVFTANSSGIAGFVIPSAGTYYFRIRENGVASTNLIRPYYLYYAIRTGAIPTETEPNNSSGTANALGGGGTVSGVVGAAADQDFYSITLGAGQTVFISLNLDPERDATQFNGRVGLGNLGTTGNVVQFADDGSAGSVANPLSETFAFTARSGGTYFIVVDDAAAGGAATSTYDLSATVILAPFPSGCTTYTNSTPTPIADLTLSSSTIVVPPTTNRIRDLNLTIVGSHTFIADLDVHLRSPNGGGNDNGVFTDVGPATVGGPQNTMDWVFDDEAAIPPFIAATGDITAIAAPVWHQPELNYRLDWFDGEDPSGTWTLDIRDDATGDVGTLSSWSLEICETPPQSGVLIYNEDFESGAGGYTHSGTADEWELGTPTTTATTTAPPRAAFLTCNSGTNCWKTDLDDTYNPSSSQDLLSSNINLTQFLGTITLVWSMRYQIETATFDHATVTVREVAIPANSRVVWEFNGSTMTNSVGNPAVNIPASAGWGLYSANISEFAGKNIEVIFHLDSDTSVQLGGLAIDDVQVFQLGPTAAGVSVGGRVTDESGRGIANTVVTLAGAGGVVRMTRTNSFGWYRIENVTVGGTYNLAASHKRYNFDTRTISVQDEISDADLVGTESSSGVVTDGP